MKKVFKSMIMVALATVLSMVVFSCSETTGDVLYDITVSDDTSTGSYMSYKASGAEAIILTECEKVGILTDKENTYILVKGVNEKDGDKAIKAAVNKGMDAVEAADNYNKLFDLSETTVVIKRGESVVFSRTFKK